MKHSVNKIVLGLCMGIASLITTQTHAQYPGGMGGGGMGGMGGMGGGRMGGMSNQSMGSPRSMGPSSADMANRQTEWMKTNLALTKEQVKEVRKLNVTYASKQQTEARALLTGDGPPSDATRQQIREVTMMINEEKEEKLKPLLTPEQWTLYQTKRDSVSKAAGAAAGTRMMGPGRTN